MDVHLHLLEYRDQLLNGKRRVRPIRHFQGSPVQFPCDRPVSNRGTEGSRWCRSRSPCRPRYGAEQIRRADKLNGVLRDRSRGRPRYWMIQGIIGRTTIVAPATASNEAVQLGQWTYGGTAAAGWRKDPAGNIEQWGQFAPINVAASTALSETVDFPIPFTLFAHVQVGLYHQSGGAQLLALYDSNTLTDFVVILDNSATIAQTFGFTWTARGR